MSLTTDQNTETESAGPRLRRWNYPRTRQRSWGAWAGSKDDLRRIGDVVAHLSEERRKQALASLSEGDENDYVANRDRREAVQKWTPLAGAGHQHEGLSGSPGEVVDALDPKLVTGFNITSGKDRYISTPTELKLTMSSEKGVTLRLESADRGWLAEAYETLTRTIGRCVPWWAFMRNKWTRWTYSALVVSAIFACFFALAFLVNPWLAVAGYVSYPVVKGLNWLVLKTVPGFEVVPDGVIPKGRRAVGIVGLLALNAFVVVAGAVLAVVLAAHLGTHVHH